MLLVGDIRLLKTSKSALDAGAMSHWLDEVGKVEVVFGNLEGPIGDFERPKNERKCRIASVQGSHRTLASLGFNVLSLANNHSMDYGHEGLTSSMKALDDSGIKYVGAGRNIKAAREPVIIQHGQERIGFLAYGWDFIGSEYATYNTPGVAPLKKRLILEDVKSFKKAVDWLIVSVHWSYEQEKFPLPYQRNLAHAIIDMGASVIVGHHPHVIQGIEHYKGGVVLYSLGNFIFPDISFGKWDIVQSHDNRSGLAVKIEFDNMKLGKLELFPFYQDGAAFVPRFYKSQRRMVTLQQIGVLSAKWCDSYNKLYKNIRIRKKVPVMTSNYVVDSSKVLTRQIGRYISAFRGKIRRRFAE